MTKHFRKKTTARNALFGADFPIVGAILDRNHGS